MKRFVVCLLLALCANVAVAGTRNLKEDTAVVIVVGPFVDSTGAAVTSPTIASIDCNLYKNDGTKVDVTLAASSSNNDMVHVDDGYFSLELTATDTSTPGYLRISFQISGALIFHEDFDVLPANIYDSRYSTDKLEVDIAQAGGSNITATGGRMEVNTTHAAGTAWNSGGITSSTFATDSITASAIAGNAIGSSELAADSIGASELATDSIGAAEMAADAIGAAEIADGAIDAATFASAAITSAAFGTGAINATVIASNAITANELADDAITAAKLATDTIGADEIADDAIDAGALAASAIGASELAADAIGASEIANDALNAAEIDADVTTELQSGLATASALATVDTVVDAIKAVTDLFVASHAEPTGVPAADETPLDKIAYVFMALRNQVDVTNSKKQYYDDSGNIEWEKDLSDNGTTYSETEGNSP